MKKVIKQKINQNEMWFKCQFPDGSYFKYSVLRYKNELTIAFSSKEHETAIQMDILMDWINRNSVSTGQLFKRFNTLCIQATTGYKLIEIINKGRVDYV